MYTDRVRQTKFQVVEIYNEPLASYRINNNETTEMEACDF